MNTLKYIIRGIGDLPDYGPHPGTPLMVILPIIGAIAGLDNGLKGAIFGFSIFFLSFSPFYLMGAYARGKQSPDKATLKSNRKMSDPSTGIPRTNMPRWRITKYSSALLVHEGEICNEIYCASHDEAECLVDVLNELTCRAEKAESEIERLKDALESL